MISGQDEQNMGLGPFILENLEPILADWEENARCDWIGPMPDVATLRDHASMMLRAVAEDMATSRTPTERKTKSKGSEDGEDSAIRSAAAKHAIARIQDGFDIERIVAEFRALRASVYRIWWDGNPAPHREQIDDMARFNEALDQLVAVSVTGYTARVEQSRRLFLGILGHDLRQPLSSLRMMAAVMAENPGLPPDVRRDFLSKIDGCCGSMAAMLHDLLDFTTTQLGAAMPVSPEPTGLETLCDELIGEVRATSPSHTFTLDRDGDLTGEWDAARLRQLLSNLLMNAVTHGSPDNPVTVTLRGTGDEVTLSVHNTGRTIPPESLAILFNPMVRLPQNDGNRLPGSTGLGLYICRQIAQAHGGVINVESSEKKGTTFTVILPRHFTPQDFPEA